MHLETGNYEIPREKVHYIFSSRPIFGRADKKINKIITAKLNKTRFQRAERLANS